MGFTETEAKIFEVSKNIDIAKTNLDKLFAKEMDGLIGIALYRTLKSSDNPNLRYYASEMENATGQYLANLIRASLHEISRLLPAEKQEFFGSLGFNIERVVKEVVSEADERYGVISDIIQAYVNPRSIPATNALKNMELNIDGIKLNGRFIQELYIRGVDGSIDLPGRNGIFNRPEINFKIPPSLLRGANTEEKDLLLNA
ncbi:MAG: hypothetical protein QXD03_00430 [Candidatus Anstonellales archaeon]